MKNYYQNNKPVITIKNSARKIAGPALIILLAGCAYFNILFNAQESYNQGLKKLDESQTNTINPAIRKDFYTAIDKCWKLLNLYGDSSSYSDDALLMIGKSHYMVEEYVKAERFLRQFTERFRESELIPEANLWLGKTLIRLEQDSEALQFLSAVKDESDNNLLKAEALYSIGELYVREGNMTLARESYRESIAQSDDDRLAARAQFEIAQTYVVEEDPDNALIQLDAVIRYDPAVHLEFNTRMQQAEILIELGRFDESVSLLQTMGRESRFTPYYSLVEATLGDCYMAQELIEDAALQYATVTEDFPRTEGSARASFGLAEIMDFYYNLPDSAIILYRKSTREFKLPELNQEANARVRIIENYLRIRKELEKDRQDLNALYLAETSSDSLGAVIDTSAADTIATAGEDTKKSPDARQQRSLEQIESSLSKNLFSMAEFFLLTAEQYDSAEVYYLRYIEQSADTLLLPKALYGLYYINQYKLPSSVTADSIKQIILNTYPDSDYAVFIDDRLSEKPEDAVDTRSPFVKKYRQAEDMIDQGDYTGAITEFIQIAENDSGSVWAEKSRFAVGWLYEKKIGDLDRAVEAYKILAEEYPKGKAGKIAQLKIKPPPVPAPEPDKTVPDSTDSQLQPR